MLHVSHSDPYQPAKKIDKTKQLLQLLLPKPEKLQSVKKYQEYLHPKYHTEPMTSLLWTSASRCKYVLVLYRTMKLWKNTCSAILSAKVLTSRGTAASTSSPVRGRWWQWEIVPNIGPYGWVSKFCKIVISSIACTTVLHCGHSFLNHS